MDTPTPDDVERLLAGMEYPISKRTLRELARERDVHVLLLAAIERLPDEVFVSHAALASDLQHVLRPDH